jgi:hypothetical protein
MTGAAAGRRWCWTVLGQRLGYTATAEQRELILDAVSRMAWTADPSAVPYLAGEAVRAVVGAVFGRRPALRQVGVAQLNCRQLLIGLEHRDGAHGYLLDLDSHALLVLADTPTVTTRHHHVA